ncbi:ABC transporter ATP-binding protein [Chondrinema litorale]|uniref:ABC transporter ATP-binding protein n=1 Tax=Chondrinema litorale TaxID=2994555 RepID=UPI00254330B2|nr:ABC transporter ATP-binding protein [Chondrinema litorale]UZR97085.1 ABC transporter ATP-binding protein [Chondrinema litorale]
MLELKNFKKTYGSVTVLEIDHLKISTGIYWIKGANGSGKSTLLKTLAGIINFEGEVLLNKTISVKKQPVAYRKLVNFAEAEPVFPEFLTGMELVKLFASAKNVSVKESEYYIESMGMSAYMSDAIGTYSSGMLKKLSLMLAFLGKPSIILLDEPLITIDAASLEILYEWITHKKQQEELSFFLSSHQTLETKNISLTGELLVQNQTVNLLAND